MDKDVFTDIEHRLVLAVKSGTILDLAPDQNDADIDEAAMQEWGVPHIINAQMLRDVIRGKYTSNFDPKGIRIRGALFDELVDLEHISSNVPLEFTQCYFRAGLTAHSSRLAAVTLSRSLIHFDWGTRTTLNLGGATISGPLSLDGIVLTGASSPALMANGLRVNGSFSLRRATVESDAEAGAISLVNAKIDGLLQFNGTKVQNINGPALRADALNVKGTVFLRSVDFTGVGYRGTVRFPGATIDGQLSLRRAVLENSNGPALSGFRLTVSRSVFLDEGFCAYGSGNRGVVYLLGAKIGGKLSAEGATIDSVDGPALSADGLRIVDDVDLAGSLLVGQGSGGVVRFRLASIGGLLSLSEAKVHSRDGAALMANGLIVASNARFDADFQGKCMADRGVVQLRGASIGGRFILDERQVGAASRGEKWEINDLTFTGYSTSGGERDGKTSRWLTFLKSGTVAYSPQVYQESAAIARGEGHDRVARKILIWQRRDRITRGGLSFPEQVWECLLDIFIGFGYQHLRTLLWLSLILVISILLSFGVFGGNLTDVADSAPQVMQCEFVDKIYYGIDLVVPFLETGASGVCEPTSGSTGGRMKTIGMLVKLAAWSLTLLFIAGFTRIIRQV